MEQIHTVQLRPVSWKIDVRQCGQILYRKPETRHKPFIFLPLQVLYMSNNSVKDWSEFQKIAELQKLQDLLFVGKHLPSRQLFVAKLWREPL